MKKNVPRKNVSPRLTDLRWPEGSEALKKEDETLRRVVKTEEAARFFRATEADMPMAQNKNTKKTVSKRWRFFVLGLAGIALLAVFALNAGQARERTLRFVVSGFQAMQSAFAHFKFFPERGVKNGLNITSSSLNDPGSELQLLFKQGSKFFQGFGGLTGSAVALSQEVNFLEEHFYDFLLTHKGDELLAHLQKAHAFLHDISTASQNISGAADSMQKITAVNLQLNLPLQSELHHLDDFLGVLLAWLEAPETHHILIFFQNPSEMRPAGGFLGSYADVTLQNVNIESIDVHDINDADRELADKIVPPQPLQLIVSRWHAADANWFFDFSDSASETIKLLESSDFYKSENIKFDGAIALSPQVVSDLLSFTGPLTLTKTKVTLTSENFLTEIQKEVQSGQAAQASYPKQILQEVTPLLLEKLRGLNANDRAKLAQFFSDWLTNKDLMAYFKNRDFEAFADWYGAAGKVYELPANYGGDYLAVVHANVGGGKTDLYIKEDVSLQAQVSADGLVTDHLEISRTHQGNKAKYWWYKVVNQDYLRVFVTPDVRLTNFKGGTKKIIQPKVNYAKSGYATDPLVRAIESSTMSYFQYPTLTSLMESGKKVFAVWSRIGVGETAKISFDYEHRLPFPPVVGQTYQFVFEKQAGSARHYHFEINAPLGLRWQENHLPSYEYDSDSPPGRMVVTLTLEAI